MFKINTILFIFLILSQLSSAQQTGNISNHFQTADTLQKISYGLSIGVVKPFYRWEQINQPTHIKDSTWNLRSNSERSFNIAFFKHFHLSRNIDMQTGIGASFLNTAYSYSNYDTSGEVRANANKINYIALELPLYGIYNFKSRNPIKTNNHFYFLAGPKYSHWYELSREGHDYYTPHDLTIDLALGHYFYKKNKYFFSPEIKFSAGFMNIKGNYHDPYFNSIKSIKRNSVFIIFKFNVI